MAEPGPLLNRRAFVRHLALAGVALGSASCGPLTRSRAPQSPSTLQLWTLDLAPKFTATIEAVLAAWERQRSPGSHLAVRWSDVPWSSVERKLLAAVFARTAPDLVNLNPPFAANLANKGGLKDLNPLLPQGAASTFLPSIWGSGQQGDSQFAIPWYLTARVTMANRDLLRRAGLSKPCP